MTSARSHWFGIVAIVAATGLFILSDTLMKLTAQALRSPFQVLFIRCVLSFLCCALLVVVTGQHRGIRGVLHWRPVLRGCCDAASGVFYMAALANMPIADTIAIGQTAPLLVIIAVAAIFREHIGPVRLALICAGFLGAVLVAQPTGSGLSPAAIFAFLTATMVATRDLLTRGIPSTIPTFIVLLVSTFLVMVSTGITALVQEPWVGLSPIQWVVMTASGIIVTLGQLAIFLAYRHTAASVVAPYYYSFTVWAVIAGLVVWGEVPNSLAIIGMLLIVGSGLALLFVRTRRAGEAVA